jgi:hypothetical protein
MGLPRTMQKSHPSAVFKLGRLRCAGVMHPSGQTPRLRAPNPWACSSRGLASASTTPEDQGFRRCPGAAVLLSVWAMGIAAQRLDARPPVPAAVRAMVISLVGCATSDPPGVRGEGLDRRAAQPAARRGQANRPRTRREFGLPARGAPKPCLAPIELHCGRSVGWHPGAALPDCPIHSCLALPAPGAGLDCFCLHHQVERAPIELGELRVDASCGPPSFGVGDSVPWLTPAPRVGRAQRSAGCRRRMRLVPLCLSVNASLKVGSADRDGRATCSKSSNRAEAERGRSPCYRF